VIPLDFSVPSLLRLTATGREGQTNPHPAKPVASAADWKNGRMASTVRCDAVILHSRADDIIPVADSEELARTSGATLIEVVHDHRLADPEPLAAMLAACEC
jgi:hypothetical protein